MSKVKKMCIFCRHYGEYQIVGGSYVVYFLFLQKEYDKYVRCSSEVGDGCDGLVVVGSCVHKVTEEMISNRILPRYGCKYYSLILFDCVGLTSSEVCSFE